MKNRVELTKGAMVLTVFLLAVLSKPAAIEPVGTAEQVRWPRNEVGFQLGPDGVVLKVEGPTAVIVEVRARARQRNQTAQIDILRDDRFISRNQRKLKRLRPAPRGYPVAARLSFEVPEGAHTYQITAGIERGAVIARTADAVDVKVAAAVETPVDGAGESDVGENTAPESAASAVEDANDAAAINGQQLMASSASAAETVASSFAGSNARKAIRVAVYDFELAAVDAPIGAVVTDSTLAEVRKLSGISAIGMDEIRDMLSHEANKQFLGCEADNECLADIAGALGVDQLVTGKLSRVDDGTAIVVRRIDQNRAVVLDTFEQRLASGSGEEFLASIGPAIEKLFPEYELRDGTERGVPAEMALRLNPPPIPTWGFYSVAGAAVISAGAATGFGLASMLTKSDFDAALESGTAEQPASGSELVSLENDFQGQRSLSNAFWISTGVLVVASTVIAFFTDWEGYQESAERLESNP